MLKGKNVASTENLSMALLKNTLDIFNDNESIVTVEYV
jgi:hypothetical protein